MVEEWDVEQAPWHPSKTDSRCYEGGRRTLVKIWISSAKCSFADGGTPASCEGGKIWPVESKRGLEGTVSVGKREVAVKLSKEPRKLWTQDSKKVS